MFVNKCAKFERPEIESMKTSNTHELNTEYVRNLQSKILFSILLICLFIPKISDAQDCFPDTEPPVLICKKIDTLMLGWCGNVQIYASEFVKSVVDNCSPRVKITFDREGRLEDADLILLLVGLDTSNNFITIYAHDNAGNVSSCSSFCFPVSMLNLKVDCNILSDYRYFEDETNKIELSIRTEDNKLHPTTITNKWYPMRFEGTISSISNPKSIVINSLDFAFDHWNISPADIIEASRMIVHSSRYPSAMNYLSADTNCDGEINLLDLYKTLQFILGNIVKDDCIAKPLARFLNDSGVLLGTETDFNFNANTLQKMGFCQRGDIDRENLFPNVSFFNPVSQIQGDPVNWKVKNQLLERNLNYVLDFEFSDSMKLFGLQFNVNFDTSLVHIDTVYSNFIGTQFNRIYPNDIQWVCWNTLDPQIDHVLPRITFHLTAKEDAKVGEVFKPTVQTISNFLVEASGNARPIGIEFSKVVGNHNTLNDAEWLQVTPIPSQGVVKISAMVSKEQVGYLELIDVNGILIHKQLLKFQNAPLQVVIPDVKSGMYFAVIRFAESKPILKTFLMIRE